MNNFVKEKVMRFIDNNDGTITDKQTKLVWIKNITPFGQKSWEEALLVPETVHNGFYGLTDGSKVGDWRIPTVNELNSLLNYELCDPAIDRDVFIGVQSSYYWSSTPYSYHPAYAWVVDLSNGGVGYGSKTYTYYVWLVRSLR